MCTPTTHWAKIFPDASLIRRKAILLAASRQSTRREVVECRRCRRCRRGCTSARASGSARHGLRLAMAQARRASTELGSQLPRQGLEHAFGGTPQASPPCVLRAGSPRHTTGTKSLGPRQTRLDSSGSIGSRFPLPIRGSRMVVAQACCPMPSGVRASARCPAGDDMPVKRANPVPAPVRGRYRVSDVDA